MSIFGMHTQMRNSRSSRKTVRPISGVVAAALLLTACAAPASAPPAAASATSAPPTAAVEPTITPTPVPQLQEITAANVGQLQTTLHIGRGAAQDLQWLPDGDVAVLYGTGLTVFTDFGVFVREVQPENKAISSDSAMSADGKRVVSLVNNRTVLVWDAETGKIVQELPTNCGLSTEKRMHKVAFSGDGSLVAGCDEDGASIWDVATGARSLGVKTANPIPSMLLFSPRTDKLVVSSSRKPDYYNQLGDIEVFDVTSGELLKSYKTQSDFRVIPFAISSSANLLAISQTGKEVTTIDLATLERVRTYPVTSPARLPSNVIVTLNAMTFTPDGTGVAVSAAGTVRIDLASGKQTAAYQDIYAGLLRYSPEGTLLAAGWDDYAIYRASSGSNFARLGSYPSYSALEFDPGGRYLAAGGGSLALWDLVEGAPALDKIKPWGLTFGFVPGRSQLLANAWNGSDWEHALSAYDLIGGSEHPISDVVPANVSTWPQPGMRSLKMCPSHACAAVAISDDYVQMIDLTTHALGPRLEGFVTDFQFSPDGRTLAVAGSGITFWDYRQGKSISQIGLSSPLESIAFSPDGKLIAGGVGAQTVQLWDAATGKAVGQLEFANYVQKLAFDPTGWLIVALAYDFFSGHAILGAWEVSTGTALYTREGTLGLRDTSHWNGTFAEFVFSPDGSLLAVKGLSEYIEFLDVSTGETLKTLDDFKAMPVPFIYRPSMAFSANGHRFAVAGYDGIIRVLAVTE